MEYSEFVKLAQKTGLSEEQFLIFWRHWRFEKTSYMTDALNDYSAFFPEAKTFRDFYGTSRNMGIILKKYRKMRIVSPEGIKDKIYNMPKILSHCGVEHDENIETLYFPLVYIKCQKCHRTVKKFQIEGVWRCVCGYEWIDAFYNVKEIMRVRGMTDITTPKENIDKLQEKLPF